MKAVCTRVADLEEGLLCARSDDYDMIFIEEGYLTRVSDKMREQFEKENLMIAIADRFAHDKDIVKLSDMEYFLYPVTTNALLDLLRRHLPGDIQTRQVRREDYEVASLYFLSEGFDFYGAMKYVADDFAQYVHLLKRFTDDERQLLLKEAYTEKDWGNYVTYVHALKNSARLIGANSLADLAYQHERYAQDGQYEAVEKSYQQLMIKWDACVECVKDYLEHGVASHEEGEVQIAGVLSEDVFRESVEQILYYLDTFQKKEALMLLKQLSAYKTDGERLKMIEQAIIALERYDYVGVTQILAGECSIREGI